MSLQLYEGENWRREKGERKKHTKRRSHIEIFQCRKTDREEGGYGKIHFGNLPD